MIQTHVFRDGIERPAHQHSNGGGWVADTAFAHKDAYIGQCAEVIGGTIRGGTIRGGTIEGGNVTRDVTFICGAIPYPVTITDDFVVVGCQWHSPEHWREHGAEIMIEDGQTPERAAFFMGLLITFIDLHGCKTTVSANA